MDRMNGADATFLYTETRRAPFEIGALLILAPSDAEPADRLARMRRQLTDRMHLVPTFRKVIHRVPFDLHHPVWFDDPHFDLDYHVRHDALPEPGTEEQLETLIGRLLSIPLDHTRPLWEMYLIDGLAEGRSAMFIKTHHALMDGVAGFNTIAATLDLEPEPGPTPAPEQPQPIPGRIPGALHMLIAAGLDLVKTPVYVAQGSLNLARDLAASRHEGTRSITEVIGASMAPATPFNVTLHGPRTVRFFDLPMEEVDDVRRQVGARVNDIALALVGGALRRYLLRRGELPGETLLTFMPIAVSNGDEARQGNSTTVMPAQLRTDLTDPMKRLAAIAEDTRAAKARARGQTAPLILDLSRLLGPGTAALAERLAVAAGVTQRLRLAGNVVISNIASIPVDLFSIGSLVERAIPIGVVNDGVGLGFTFVSYRGQLSFSMLADSSALPDPDVLLGDVMDEWDAMVAAAEAYVADA